MRAILYTVSILCSAIIVLPAQITITQNDAPRIGDSLTYYTDTLSGIGDIGGSGPDQVWDFTQLAAHDTFSIRVLPAGGAPNADLFPEADLAIETDGVYLYGQLTDEELFNLGTAVDILGTGTPFLVRFEPPQQLFRFPTTFGTAYSSTYAFTVEAAGADFGVPVDSVRFSRTTVETGTVDSYGILTTPAGAWDALRLEVTSENADTIYAQVAGVWAPVQTLETTAVEYRWLARDVGIVMSIFPDENGEVEGVDWLAALNRTGEVAAPQAQFAYADQGEGAFSFTDQSSNNPTSWRWDFDDGTSSNLQNPTHTYTSSGEYNICLTASNSGGFSTTCQTVTVLLSSLETLREDYGFQLFPNPVQDRLQLQLDYPGVQAPSVSFYNFAGQHLLTKTFNGQLSVNTNPWPAGTVTFVVRSPEGNLLGSGRVVKK